MPRIERWLAGQLVGRFSFGNIVVYPNGGLTIYPKTARQMWWLKACNAWAPRLVRRWAESKIGVQ